MNVPLGLSHALIRPRTIKPLPNVTNSGEGVDVGVGVGEGVAEGNMEVGVTDVAVCVLVSWAVTSSDAVGVIVFGGVRNP